MLLPAFCFFLKFVTIIVTVVNVILRFCLAIHEMLFTAKLFKFNPSVSLAVPGEDPQFNQYMIPSSIDDLVQPSEGMHIALFNLEHSRRFIKEVSVSAPGTARETEGLNLNSLAVKSISCIARQKRNITFTTVTIMVTNFKKKQKAGNSILSRYKRVS